ncbi:MBL fold metallo-hydrolase [Subtercola sp. YIM 133946]|uniref:MBL fold metallo-hydrolase n=1 Tax=Subtercola sp. YIM 133946 TaxID=3118909 RepID=UPI002F95A203
MKLGPSLHRIGNDIVAVYLIVTDEGITVIDAGLPGMYADLKNELATIGRSLADIRGAIITHGDSDHIGFAEQLRRETGVPIYLHEADAARSKGLEKTKSPGGHMKIGPTLGFAAYSLRKGMFSPKYLTEVSELVGGETLDLPGAPQIIRMPGHSPGSIAVYSPLVDAVFVGDALTTRHVLNGVTGMQPAPFTDDPAEALESLSHLEGITATWVLPGHGAPYGGGTVAAVRETRAAAAGA